MIKYLMIHIYHSLKKPQLKHQCLSEHKEAFQVKNTTPNKSEHV